MKNHFKKINREKSSKLFKNFDDMLKSKDARGASRNEAKKDGSDQNKIFSTNTYNTYRNTLYDFSVFVRELEPNIKQPRQAKKYIDDFLKSYQDKGASNWTIKNKRSALTKVYGKDYSTLKIGKCARSEIKRSREQVERDAHFSEEKNKDLVNLCKHTGLRRCEVERLKGGCVSQHQDGNWYIDGIKGKGGKIRNIRILDNDRQTIDLINSKQSNEYVFKNVSKNADIHSYRAYYASELYSQLENPNKKDYHCRNDLKGISYDRSAMLTVSRNLGHNRISVIASNYLYKVK